MKQSTTIIISIATMLVSVAALCISLLRCEPITMDWMGVLVVVLSFLVTLVLGWNIYIPM